MAAITADLLHLIVAVRGNCLYPVRDSGGQEEEEKEGEEETL